MTKLKGRIPNSETRSSDGLARAILDDLGHDNGCRFVPCRYHGRRLVKLVGEVWAQGLEFTDYQIATIAYGEETEQAELLKPYASGPALDRVLAQIFDGCRHCHTELPLRFQEAVKASRS